MPGPFSDPGLPNRQSFDFMSQPPVPQAGSYMDRGGNQNVGGGPGISDLIMQMQIQKMIEEQLAGAGAMAGDMAGQGMDAAAGMGRDALNSMAPHGSTQRDLLNALSVDVGRAGDFLGSVGGQAMDAMGAMGGQAMDAAGAMAGQGLDAVQQMQLEQEIMRLLQQGQAAGMDVLGMPQHQGAGPARNPSSPTLADVLSAAGGLFD